MANIIKIQDDLQMHKAEKIRKKEERKPKDANNTKILKQGNSQYFDVI